MKKTMMLFQRISLLLIIPIICFGQSLQPPTPSTQQLPQKEAETPTAPKKIDVKPTARDSEIESRLEGILNATGWFRSPDVRVREGVVFLQGYAKTKEYQTWAGQLASNTQDVSAVVNKIEVVQPSVWDFEPSLKALKHLWIDLVRILPSLFFGIFILLITWGVAKGVSSLSKKFMKHRIASPLLQKVLSQAIALIIFLFGLYIVFKMLGLTAVAFTIIGGTGILGIILGIAFRDISENLLASIFLSIHHPFRSGDLVKIGENEGYIQRLTIRSTVMINLTGNHVQIPNATVYKNDITNYSVNPNRGESFLFEIDLGEDIPKTQEIVLQVLENHPTVLKDPEPMVLAEEITRSLAQLRVYFWLDGSKHSWLKVRSSVIRLVKNALQQQNIVFAIDQHSVDLKGPISVDMVTHPKEEETKPVEPKEEPVATQAEGDLKSEFENMEEQARSSRDPEKGDQDLLSPRNPPS